MLRRGGGRRRGRAAGPAGAAADGDAAERQVRRMRQPATQPCDELPLDWLVQ
ncbi:hypothetical protein ACP70R_004605 [Stipagrostis hirtigluma subsp. patula]